MTQPNRIVIVGPTGPQTARRTGNLALNVAHNPAGARSEAKQTEPYNSFKQGDRCMKNFLRALVALFVVAGLSVDSIGCSGGDAPEQEQLQCSAEVDATDGPQYAFYYASLWRTGDDVIGVCSVSGSSGSASGTFVGQGCVLPNYEFDGGAASLLRGRQLDGADADEVWVTIGGEFVVAMDCFRAEDL